MSEHVFRIIVFIAALVSLANGASADGDILETSASDPVPVVQDGKCGYINAMGKVVIRPRFEDCERFSEGLAHVEIGGKFGYIDRRGEMVIPARFTAWGNDFFSEGLAAVNVGDLGHGQWGFIDHRGVFAIDPRFEFAGFFRNGRAFVVIGGQRGFIDNHGQLVVAPQYEMVEFFSEGLCAVRRATDNHLWGFIDTEGSMVIPPRYSEVSEFREGLAAVTPDGDYGKSVCIDRTGKMVIDHPCGFFSEGLAAVNLGAYPHGRWGFRDKAGAYAIEARFEDARPFWNGLAAVKLDGRWGYINKMGTVVIKPQFDFAGNFSNGLAPVGLEGQPRLFLPHGAKGYGGGKLGYIDKTGKEVWAPTK